MDEPENASRGTSDGIDEFCNDCIDTPSWGNEAFK